VAKLIIGSRGSALALAQARWVAERLSKADSRLQVEIAVIQTEGDRTQAAQKPLSSFGEKGIFAKEIEAALIAGTIDAAVHSAKDLAANLPEGLAIAAVPEREDSRDAILGSPLSALPAGAVVGTGSARRTALIAERRPDLRVESIRGNVGTRIEKLHAGLYQAIVLAVAGLKRLGLEHEIAQILDPLQFVPDPGQGALAIECRVGDIALFGLIKPIDHVPSHIALLAERAFLQALGAGCQNPVGAWARIEGEALVITALAAGAGGRPIRRASISGPPDAPDELGRRVARLVGG
jgi:hydroxymethylbilane synthase